MGLVPILLALVLFVSPNKAYAQDCETTKAGTICASLVGNDVVVTLLGLEIARISAPIREVKVEVPVPGPTIRLPGPTETVTIPVPGPTEYLPGPSAPTATATVTLSPGQEGVAHGTINPSARPSETTNAPSASNAPEVTTTVTASPEVVVDEREREKKVTVTIPQAIGASVGLLLLGLLLGLSALYAAYTVGYKDSEQAQAKAWRRFSDDLFGKRKH